MSLFGSFDFNPHPQADLGRQVASLSRDAAHLADVFRHFAGSTRRDVSSFASHAGHDLGDAAWRGGRIAAKVVGKQAFLAGKAVGRDPVPAMVAVAGLACLLSLVTSKPRRR